MAFEWDKRKGIDIFVELVGRLGKEYQIVLVGVNEETKEQLPKEIITLRRTKDKRELAELYSIASVFVNPTRDEVFGMVNIEAQACGTPVITFDSGGSSECISEKTGFIVDCGDIYNLVKKINRVCFNNIFDKKDCVRHAQSFEAKRKYLEYIDLYKGVLH